MSKSPPIIVDLEPRMDRVQHSNVFQSIQNHNKDLTSGEITKQNANNSNSPGETTLGQNIVAKNAKQEEEKEGGFSPPINFDYYAKNQKISGTISSRKEMTARNPTASNNSKPLAPTSQVILTANPTHVSLSTIAHTFASAQEPSSYQKISATSSKIPASDRDSGETWGKTSSAPFDSVQTTSGDPTTSGSQLTTLIEAHTLSNLNESFPTIPATVSEAEDNNETLEVSTKTPGEFSVANDRPATSATVGINISSEIQVDNNHIEFGRNYNTQNNESKAMERMSSDYNAIHGYEQDLTPYYRNINAQHFENVNVKTSPVLVNKEPKFSFGHKSSYEDFTLISRASLSKGTPKPLITSANSVAKKKTKNELRNLSSSTAPSYDANSTPADNSSGAKERGKYAIFNEQRNDSSIVVSATAEAPSNRDSFTTMTQIDAGPHSTTTELIRSERGEKLPSLTEQSHRSFPAMETTYKENTDKKDKEMFVMTPASIVTEGFLYAATHSLGSHNYNNDNHDYGDYGFEAAAVSPAAATGAAGAAASMAASRESSRPFSEHLTAQRQEAATLSLLLLSTSSDDGNRIMTPIEQKFENGGNLPSTSGAAAATTQLESGMATSNYPHLQDSWETTKTRAGKTRNTQFESDLSVSLSSYRENEERAVTAHFSHGEENRRDVTEVSRIVQLDAELFERLNSLETLYGDD